MYQKITIVGNLGRDPEMRFTSKGKAVTSFSVATNRRYTNNNGEKIEEVTWFRITVWGAQAESCNEYLSKGRPVLVEGRLIPDPETGCPKVFKRKDGSYGSSFDINAQKVRFLPGSEAPRDEKSEIEF